MSNITRMVRTQVYLTEEQHAALRREAARSGVSMTEELRRLIDRHILAKGVDPELEREPYFRFIGIGADAADVAEKHDEYLATALREPNIR